MILIITSTKKVQCYQVYRARFTKQCRLDNQFLSTDFAGSVVDFQIK